MFSARLMLYTFPFLWVLSYTKALLVATNNGSKGKKEVQELLCPCSWSLTGSARPNLYLADAFFWPEEPLPSVWELSLVLCCSEHQKVFHRPQPIVLQPWSVLFTLSSGSMKRREWHFQLTFNYNQRCLPFWKILDRDKNRGEKKSLPCCRICELL